MKASTIVLGASAALVAAQSPPFPNGFPACGSLCITNMVDKANEFSCEAGNAQCLCSDVRFIYGVRDCSDQACPSQDDAEKVKEFGVNYCAAAGIAISGVISTTPSGTFSETTTIVATASPTTPGVPASAPAGGSAISTVTFLSTYTSGDSTLTSTILSTITGGSGGTGSTETLTTSGVTNGSSFTSTITTVSSNSGTETGSATGTATLPTTETTGTGAANTSPTGTEHTPPASSTSSEGGSPQATAAPIGIMAAAGLAALFL